METSITQVSPVEYELDIRADRETIDERVNGQLRKLRPAVQVKGFRPGKVPIGMVKRLHGKSVAYEVVDELVQEVYKSEVLDSTEHDVIGSPTITKLEFEPDGDLYASITFGVKPKIELVDLSNEAFDRLTHEVDSAEVEAEIERIRSKAAKFEPVDGPAGEDDFVRVDLHQLDHHTDTPIIGSRQEGVVFHLGAEDLDERVKSALRGTTGGETARFSIHHDDHGHDHRYVASVVDIQKRTLPELTDELVVEATEGRLSTVGELEEDMREQLRSNWERAFRERLEDDIVRRIVELHEFDVPASVIETYLDSLVQDVAQRNNGKLPNGFDTEHFRQQNRDEAERMARWMLIRERIIEEHGLEVTSEDLDSEFGKMGGSEEGSGTTVRRMFEQHYPGMVEQIHRRLESRKVFDWLADHVKLVDKEWVDDREAD